MSEERSFVYGFIVGVLTCLGALCLCLLCIGQARAQSIFTDGFEAPADYCVALADNPLVAPDDWQAVNKTWVQAFRTASNPSPEYPDSGGAPVPLKVIRGTYVAIAIAPLANQSVSLSWEEAQSLPGYSSLRRQGSMFFALSPCPGDFRPSDFGASGDPWLQNGCRRGPGRSGGLVWQTLGSPSNNGSCQLMAGQTYYLNQISADPNDGLTAGEHKCDFETSPGCDVIATQHPN